MLHVVLSIFAGCIVSRLWRLPAFSYSAAILSGVFVDLDHLIDYFIAFGMNFRLDWFISGRHFIKDDKSYVFFHGWEYVVILAAAVFFLRSKTAKSICMALSLGLFFHLLFDTAVYNFSPEYYSVFYRASKGFDVERLVDSEHYKYHMEKKAEVFPTK